LKLNIFEMKFSLLVIWILLLRVHATEEHAESSTELLCPHQDEDKEQTHRPKRNALRSIRDLGKRFWQGFISILPGERARPQLAVQVPVVVDLIQIQQRKARSSSALTIQSESCVKAYPGDNELVIVEEDEPHIGMVLEVYHEGAGESQVDVAYELEEPLHLELGVTAKHALDWAYTPVNSSSNINGTASSQHEQVLEKKSNHGWWEWWLPWGDDKQDHYSQYRMKDGAFAGGSHGEVWRGRRRCRKDQQSEKYCKESLIFKLLRVDRGYKILEAGLREVHFGSWLAQQQENHARMYTSYLDHFFRERRPGRELELWIVFRDAGPSLRNYLYTGVSVGDYVVYQHSKLWTQLRMSISRRQNSTNDDKSVVPLPDSGDKTGVEDERASLLGRRLMKMLLRQMIESVAFLHENGVIHRDIKPSNILCKTNLDLENLTLINGTAPVVQCVLADFSSAWNNYTDWNIYTRGPSRAEQTDEYAPPEAVFGSLYDSQQSLTPQFDS
jgi:hypothetical protein